MGSTSESLPPSSTVGWDDIPMEIFFYIFRKIDITSLRRCFSVCKKWREIANDLCELDDLWPAIAKDGMVNNGVTQRQKSMLSWKALYFNSFLWKYLPSATVHKIHEMKKSNIMNLHIYNDKLIVVNPGGVEYYDIDTFQIVRIHSVNVCVDVQETDDILILATNNHSGMFYRVTVFVKLEKNEEIDLDHYIGDYLRKNETMHCFAEAWRWRLVGNRAYVIDEKSCLWECAAENKLLSVRALARFFGDHFTRGHSLNTIHVVEEDLYVSVEWGTGLLKCEKGSRMFRKVKSDEIPTIIETGLKPAADPSAGIIDAVKDLYTVRVHKFDAFIKYPISAEFLHGNEAPLNMVHYHYDDQSMTSGLQHGDVVFRGFDDGVILLDMLRDNSRRHLNVRQLDLGFVKDPAVQKMEVFELQGMHKMFVSTKYKLYTVLLKYPESRSKT